MNSTFIRRATLQDLQGIKELLEEASLPTLGIEQHAKHFIVADSGAAIVGAIGLEVYGETALLRSAVVTREEQGKGIGSLLFDFNLEEARRLGVRRLLLLTNTAEKYFEKKGFHKIDQAGVTGAVTTSVGFSGACPAHAACMERIL